MLAALTTRFPDLKKQLYSDEGKLRSFVNVYLNDEDIRYIKKEATPVAPTRYAFHRAQHRRWRLRWLKLSVFKDEILRYSRHLIMPEVGMEGQLKLKQASVLLVGAGGLGAPLALYLTAAGIGRIGLVDFDVVDFTNLQRQVIHGTKDVGKKKIDSAFETMRDINPFVELDRHETALSSENAFEIFKDYDIRRRWHRQLPHALSGQRRLRAAQQAQRLRLDLPLRRPGDGLCIPKAGLAIAASIPEPPPPGLVPSCAEGGVLGILPGVIGLIQATETVKLILGIGQPLIGRLMLYDALAMKFRELKLRRNPECPICGDNRPSRS